MFQKQRRFQDRSREFEAGQLSGSFARLNEINKVPFLDPNVRNCRGNVDYQQPCRGITVTTDLEYSLENSMPGEMSMQARYQGW